MDTYYTNPAIKYLPIVIPAKAGIHWMPDQVRHDGGSLFNRLVNNVVIIQGKPCSTDKLDIHPDLYFYNRLIKVSKSIKAEPRRYHGNLMNPIKHCLKIRYAVSLHYQWP